MPEEKKSFHNQVQIIGFVVDNDRDKVAEKAPERLAEFDARVGRKKFLPTNYYSVEDTLLYQKVACEILYGNQNLENYRKLGAWDFQLVLNTQYGRIAASLFAKDFRSALLNFPRIINAAVKGMNLSTKEIGEKEVELSVERDPYPSTYWLGLIEEAMRNYYHKQGTIKVIEGSKGARRLIVKWQ